MLKIKPAFPAAWPNIWNSAQAGLRGAPKEALASVSLPSSWFVLWIGEAQLSELFWELTVTASMEFCSSSQPTSSTFTLCTSPIKTSLLLPLFTTQLQAPPCWCQGTSWVCYLGLCWEKWALSLLPQQPQGVSSPPQAVLAGAS